MTVKLEEIELVDLVIVTCLKCKVIKAYSDDTVLSPAMLCDKDPKHTMEATRVTRFHAKL